MPLTMTDEQLAALGKYLSGPMGCNFHLRNPADPASVTWDCDGTLRKTIAFMQEHGIDVAANIAHLVVHAGNCDCEIYLNALDAVARESSFPLPDTMVRKAYDANHKLLTVVWSAHGPDAEKLLAVAKKYVGTPDG